jgi:hypothetical protein
MNPADKVPETYRRIPQQGEWPVWIHLIPEEMSLACAEVLGAMDEELLLHGMAFAIKDNTDFLSLGFQGRSTLGYF